VSQRPEMKEQTMKGILKSINDKKHTIEGLKEIYKQAGCTLLSTEYKDNKGPLKFICVCGKEGENTFNKFSKGHRCSDIKCIDTRKKETFVKRYNSITYTGTPEYKEKHKKTCLAKYGVEHPAQSSVVQAKIEKTGHSYKKYTLPSGIEINIQGYEHFAILHLLESYDEDDMIFERAKQPEIWYNDKEGKKHRYFSDIYIPKENRIVEVKSTWTYQKGTKEGKLILQEKACRDAGYDYELLIFDECGKRA
jgi:hypothetical protein